MRRLPGVSGDVGVGGIRTTDVAGRVRDRDIVDRQVVLLSFAGDLTGHEPPPGFVALVDDLSSVLLVLGLAGEGELVLGLAIGDLVDPEPLIGSTDQARQVPLDILNVVELGGKGVVDVNDKDLPVGLAFIEQSHDTKNLDLLDLSDIADLLADLADIEGIVITACLGLSVSLGGVLPCLGESTVVPDVTVVGEAVADVAETALLDVLLDGIEELAGGDLHLRIGPAGDLDDHVEDTLVLVGEEGDVVEGGDDGAILLDEHTVFEGVRSADEARGILLGHGGRRSRKDVCVLGESAQG